LDVRGTMHSASQKHAAGIVDIQFRVAVDRSRQWR